MEYIADTERYGKMKYRRCGNTGLFLPIISLGLWQNFGKETSIEIQKQKLHKAFDLGITHFDLANNYGLPANGSAEENFGKILKDGFGKYRDEMVISTKAGFPMWDGPYGDWGSRKYLISSLDQSLKRMRLDYVDIFYHHRPDPGTPLEETMTALADIVRQGKALYIGISNYEEIETKKSIEILSELKVPCLVNQIRYNFIERWPEEDLFDILGSSGVGCICYSPLAQGLLTNKYLSEIPEDSRAARTGTSIAERYFNDKNMLIVKNLNEVAVARGQSLAQMALSWVLRKDEITSVLIGASKVIQIEDNVSILNHLDFTEDEIDTIENILKTDDDI
ncbi:MAG: aldo/keto reductase [Fusobacteriaceae bacterium]|jgi:L-glyceraldehyde 3-phosphate reductase|nr:aldo/keto reductase [Fusobacteriaceae bacterium]